MVTSSPDLQEVAALRALVDGFIQERLELKLDKLTGDEDEMDDLDVQRRNEATLTAAVAWAREPRTLVTNHGTIDLPETPEAFDLRAHILRNAEAL